ncbi:MAG: family 10 glycosylhydrolase [Ignavibacteria bacterium]|jgi:uncharacterized lipoprotein YddW (UPF0748 family)
MTALRTATVVLIIISQLVFSQTKRETRAVWVATNFRLDWPPRTLNEEEQKTSLIRILDNIKKKKLNTVYFQVRSNGTVMYNSAIEPFSPYFTGEVGKKPAYDPLKFAIKEAHKRGLELHAWINVVRCFSGKETHILNHNDHACKVIPDLVKTYNENGSLSYWLDPGYPEARNYLLAIVKEIALSYKVDGIHLDYIRYPGKNFNDNDSYEIYGSQKRKDEWRRENISYLVEQISNSVKEINPLIKVGAAPIGIYKNRKGAYGLEGYNDIYQDTRYWLEQEWIDYAVPQIYWPFNNNPKFDVLAKEWSENSFNKNIILGIGAYKPEVKIEIEKMINYSREINASGIAIFRYSNIDDYYFASFAERALPSAMPWIDTIKPNSPRNLALEIIKDEVPKLKLSWEKPPAAKQNGVGYYALYRLLAEDEFPSSDSFFEIIEADKTSVILVIEKPRHLKYYFALTAVDRLWNESNEPSNYVEYEVPQIKNITAEIYPSANPVLLKEKTGKLSLLIFSNIAEEIELIGMNKNEEKVIKKENIGFGKNILSLPKNLEEFEQLKINRLASRKEEILKL